MIAPLSPAGRPALTLVHIPAPPVVLRYALSPTRNRTVPGVPESATTPEKDAFAVPAPLIDAQLVPWSSERSMPVVVAA